MTKSEKFILIFNRIAIILYIIKLIATLVVSIIFPNSIQIVFDVISCIALLVTLLNTLGIIKKEVLVQDNRIEYETSVPILFIFLPRIVEIFIIYVIIGGSGSFSTPSLIVSCGVDIVLTAYAYYDKAKHTYVAEFER